MRQITSTTKASPITIIQGAFERFCASEADAVYESRQLETFVFELDLEPAVATTQENWLKFQGLVVAWKEQRGATSSVTESVMCPAYQGIIGMGDDAVPFLLRQLTNEGDDPDQWFWALKAITRADPDPVSEDERGDNLRMARAWFDWGIRMGYAW